MERLTSNKNVSDMSMIELAHNSCYVDNKRNARYRDYNLDINSRELVRNLVKDICDEDLTDLSDEEFDEYMGSMLSVEIDSTMGLLALFYRNLWAMSDLREMLKEYEDLEEQGRLVKLPFMVGDRVYQIDENFIEPCTVEVIFLANYRDKDGNYCNMAEIHYDRDDCPYVSTEMYFTDIGKTVFLTKSEAEIKLKELRGNNE